MKKLLVVTSSPMKDSLSNELAKYFADNISDRSIEFIDLTKVDFPKYTESMDKVIGGKANESEILENKPKMVEVNKLHEQFVNADEYVFSFPNWNLMCPPDMVSYMLSVIRVGSTFKYTEQGSVGLLKNRKAVIINASGGLYEENITSLGIDWMKQALLLTGIEEQYVVAADGLELPPFKRELVRDKAVQKINQILKNF